jgi:hypothetical protein
VLVPKGRITWIACLVTASLASWPCAASNQEMRLSSAVGWGDAETHAYDETVRRALALLPSQPKEGVVVIDADRVTPALRQSLQSVDAFVMKGESVVYLRVQGELLQHAHRIGKSFDYALAAVIWHEMAHIRGADEREAQRQEEELWKQFLLQRRVEPGPALRYLSLLRKRHAPMILSALKR